MKGGWLAYEGRTASWEIISNLCQGIAQPCLQPSVARHGADSSCEEDDDRSCEEDDNFRIFSFSVLV
jgi:hypothetical protein